MARTVLCFATLKSDREVVIELLRKMDSLTYAARYAPGGSRGCFSSHQTRRRLWYWRHCKKTARSFLRLSDEVEALQYASSELKNDCEIVMVAEAEPKAIVYASVALCNGGLKAI